jgi:hypothetical protein
VTCTMGIGINGEISSTIPGLPTCRCLHPAVELLSEWHPEIGIDAGRQIQTGQVAWDCFPVVRDYIVGCSRRLGRLDSPTMGLHGSRDL